MDSLADRLRDCWSSIGISLRAGVSQETIESFESKHGILLPASFGQYLVTMNGMKEGDCDNEMISFWSLDSIATVPECLSGFAGVPDYSRIGKRLRDAGSYFVFADYLIWSHVYAIRLSPGRADDDNVLWLCGSEYCLAADSFSDFVERYLDNPENILFPRGEKGGTGH